MVKVIADSTYNICALNDVKVYREIKNRLIKYKKIYMRNKNTRRRDIIKYYLLTTNFLTFKLFHHMRKIYQIIRSG